MKKTIQILSVIISVAILSLIIIFVFNPLELRTKIISSIINSYLSNTIENYTPINNSSTVTQPNDKHPLLNESQQKTLESFGVNVEQLPSSVTPGMEACFIEKLGKERTDEIVKGASPSTLEFFKTKDCLGK